MDSDFHGDTWQLIVETIGEDGARALAGAFGGTEVYLSDKPTGVLARAIGVEHASALVLALGTHKWTCPMGPSRGPTLRRRLIRKLLNDGKSYREVALEVGVHLRTVQRVAAELRRGRHRRQRRRLVDRTGSDEP